MSAQADTPTLRVLRVEDLDAVADLEARIFAEDPWTPAMVAEELALEARHYVGVEVDGVLVGYAGTTLAPEADVMTIGVLAAARGRGLGRLLLTDILAAAVAGGARRVFLEVRASNEAAIGLYASVGFHRIGRIRRYFRHPTEDAVTMRLDVGAAGGEGGGEGGGDPTA